MTTPAPKLVWQGTATSGTYRIVDLGAGQTPRFVMEQQQPPDAMGGVGWGRVGLPFSDALEAALAQLVPSA